MKKFAAIMMLLLASTTAFVGCTNNQAPNNPGEGNSNSLQYSCLGSPMDRGAWQAGVSKESDMTW